MFFSVCVLDASLCILTNRVPQDAEKARQEHEDQMKAKDEQHAEELKTVKDGLEAEMKAKDERHADQIKAKDVMLRDLETRRQAVETARATLEKFLRQKVVE